MRDVTTPTEPRRGLTSHPAIHHLRAHAHWLVPAGLVLLSMALLFWRLDQPPRIIFDETYYVEDAKSFLTTGGVEESFAVHPPVGKWIIAASIQVFGDTSFGWRAGGAFVGGGITLLTWLLGMRLFRRRWQAVVATLLLMVDGLFVVQARTAMLDIHLGFFVALGAWLLVRDLQALDDAGPDGLVGRSRPDRWLAGVAFGLAAGTKWSGLLALGAGIVLVIGFELVARRRVHGTPWRRPGRLALGVLVPLLLVPVGTYVLTYAPWLVAYEHTTEGIDDCNEATERGETCTYPPLARAKGLVREHVDIARFHRDLESTHAYRSQPHTWVVLARPISYYYETCPADADAEKLAECEIPVSMAAEVLALGNPALWWGWALLVPLLTGAMGRRDPAAWVILGFHGGLFIPWLAVARPAFFFYMVPALPFLALGAAAALGRLRARPNDWLPWVAGLTAGLTGAVALRVLGRDGEAAAIAFGVGWVLGPLVATSVAEWRAARHREPSALPEPAVWQPTAAPDDVSRLPALIATILLVGAAAAAFVYFLPLWYGIPIDADALRAKWWFDSWI